MIASILLAAIVIFASWRFADLWFDDLGGLRWFWSGRHVGLLHATSRAAFVLATLSAVLMGLPEYRVWFGISALLFLAYHTSTLLIISEKKKW